MSRRMQGMRQWLRDTAREYRTDVAGLLTIAGCCLVMAVVGLPCPILYLTGISCAGCGMTRAWIALLHLDLRTAYFYHPLFWIPVVAVVIMLFKKRIPDKLYRGLWLVLILLMFGVYFQRMFSESDTVVVFHPKEGLLWRAADKIASLAGR